MSRDISIVETDLSRRRHRHLMQAAQRRMEGYQTLWMTSEFDDPAYLRGRYLAAKEFWEWLQGGGAVADAQAYLDGMVERARKECADWDRPRFNAALNTQVKAYRARRERYELLGAKAEAERTKEEQSEWIRLHFELDPHLTMTEEEVTKRYAHVYTPGFAITPDEERALKDLYTQHMASEVEVGHIERLLKDPFVAGLRDTPLPSPPRAVTDDTEYDDENEEPDP